jgi:uncharacterized oxidoreductase
MDAQKPIVILADKLRAFADALLQAGGFSPEEAALTAKSLIQSNLMGYDSHGVIRVAEYVGELKKGILANNVGLAIQVETASTCVADGQRGLGQVQMPRLLDLLIEKSKNNGVVSGALRNCGHVGRLGEWVEYIAGKGLAGFVAVNDNGVLHIVAPPGGKEGRTSTNPIAFGIPLPNGDVFTIDISTSATALGKMRLAYISGESCASHLFQDTDGNPSTDPSVLFKEPKGALLPMGGYKGFALSMMVDCLVAGLSGGFAPPAPKDALLLNSVVVCLWNPENFAGLAHMQQEAKKYLAFVHATKPINPGEPVRIPGDRSGNEKAKRLQTGIPLSRGSCEKLSEKAKRFGVSLPEEFLT